MNSTASEVALQAVTQSPYVLTVLEGVACPKMLESTRSRSTTRPLRMLPHSSSGNCGRDVALRSGGEDRLVNLVSDAPSEELSVEPLARGSVLDVGVIFGVRGPSSFANGPTAKAGCGCESARHGGVTQSIDAVNRAHLRFEGSVEDVLVVGGYAFLELDVSPSLANSTGSVLVNDGVALLEDSGVDGGSRRGAGPPTRIARGPRRLSRGSLRRLRSGTLRRCAKGGRVRVPLPLPMLRLRLWHRDDGKYDYVEPDNSTTVTESPEVS